MFKRAAKADGKPILNTERLRLRELVADDAAFILELVNDPDWLRHIGDRGVRTLRDAGEFIAEGPLASYSSYGYGLWLVELKSTGEPVGLCGVLKRKHLLHPDLGYALLPAFRKQGLALEACRGVVQYANEHLDTRILLAVVSSGNSNSLALLQKLGFERAGNVAMPGQEEKIPLFEKRLA